MVIKDNTVIKNIVRSNFDKSALLYEKFEKRYGFFKKLTHQLAESCGIRKGMNVVDIGCGTGTSSFILAKLVGPEGRTIGIDLSEEMLRLAKEKLDQNPDIASNIDFIVHDAELLNECIHHYVDAILYNATIFLIPNPQKTLQASYTILSEDGIVGLNYLIGVYDHDGERGIDLFQLVRKKELACAPYGRKLVDVGSLSGIMKKVGFRNVRGGTLSKIMSTKEMKDFYSIPAQSAGLYPKTPYEKRLKLLETLLNNFEDSGIDYFYQRWGWDMGVK